MKLATEIFSAEVSDAKGQHKITPSCWCMAIRSRGADPVEISFDGQPDAFELRSTDPFLYLFSKEGFSHVCYKKLTHTETAKGRLDFCFMR